MRNFGNLGGRQNPPGNGGPRQARLRPDDDHTDSAITDIVAAKYSKQGDMTNGCKMGQTEFSSVPLGRASTGNECSDMACTPGTPARGTDDCKLDYEAGDNAIDICDAVPVGEKHVIVNYRPSVDVEVSRGTINDTGMSSGRRYGSWTGGRDGPRL